MTLRKIANRERWTDADTFTVTSKSGKYYLTCKKEVSAEEVSLWKSQMTTHKASLEAQDPKALRDAESVKIQAEIDTFPS